MGDELDPKLLAAFAHARGNLPDTDFVARVLERIERQQRRAFCQHTALVIAALALLTFAAPSILTATAAALSFVTERSGDYSSLLLTPAGWAVSLCVGALVLRRSLRTR